MFTAKLQKSSKKAGWTCVVWPACVARHHRQQVLRLAETLRQSERAQRLGSPGFLAGGVGEAGHHRVHLRNPLEGYRRLTFMMLDADIVAVSPSSVWRVLSQAGLLSKWNGES